MDGDASAKWAAVAEAYAAGKLTVSQICAKHRITRKALYAQARKQGWPRRRPLPRHRSRESKPRFGKERARAALISRLYKALEQKMSEFESRRPDGPQTAADHERDTRTLNTMVRLFERLSLLDEKATVAAAGKNSCGDLIPDARTLREDLARRLERLRAEHGA